MPYPFVESPHLTRSGGRSIDVVVIHTMEIVVGAGGSSTGGHKPAL